MNTTYELGCARRSFKVKNNHKEVFKKIKDADAGDNANVQSDIDCDNI